MSSSTADISITLPHHDASCHDSKLDDEPQTPRTPTKATGVQSDMIEVAMSLSPRGGSAKYSDLDIICGDRKFKVHKAIVCSKSAYFERIVESNFREATNNTIDLSAESLPTVEAMINHIYDRSIHPQIVGPDMKPQEYCTFYIDLCTLADRVELANLVSSAALYFQTNARQFWNDAAFLETCKEVYSRLPELTNKLREAIVSVVVVHLEQLVRKDEFHDMLVEVPMLAAAVASAVGRQLVTVKYKYKNCRYQNRPWSIGSSWTVKPLIELACIHCTVVGKLERVYPEDEGEKSEK